jgi:hypothetical protein
MKIYLAGEVYGEKVFEHFNYNFNRLDSFFYVKNSEVYQSLIPKYNRYILDSGAFTFIMSKTKKKIDIDVFTDEYIEFILKNKIKLFFEMDVDKVYGYEKVKQLRNKIEAKTGMRSIPVFHMNRGLEDFIAMCKDYEYVSLGIAGKDVSWGDWKSFLPFVMKAKEHKCKVHGLGITGMNVLDKVPFYSVDSSSWTSGNRYKNIFRFDGKYVKTMKVDLKNKRISNHLNLAKHNFEQWMKFSHSMENKMLT